MDYVSKFSGTEIDAAIERARGLEGFAGIATPDTVPVEGDENVFYLASEAGKYVNFGEGVELILQGLYVLSRNAETKAWEVHPLANFAGWTKGNFSEVFNSLTNIAPGSYSHAEGYYTIASKAYSHAEGYNTEASGECSHAEGYKTTASKAYSHAEGYNTEASGECSHAEGYNTEASGECSHAEGYNTEARGDASHAEGYKTVAGAFAGHAEGNECKAPGASSHAEGYFTQANSDISHAEGQETVASGYGAHAEGYKTEAAGSRSHAGGSESVAGGENGFAHGRGLRTVADNSVAFGKFNRVGDNIAMCYGNGASDAERSNAYELHTDGALFIKGIGGFDGTNPDAAKTFQEVMEEDGVSAGEKIRIRAFFDLSNLSDSSWNSDLVADIVGRIGDGNFTPKTLYDALVRGARVRGEAPTFAEDFYADLNSSVINSVYGYVFTFRGMMYAGEDRAWSSDLTLILKGTPSEFTEFRTITHPITFNS